MEPKGLSELQFLAAIVVIGCVILIFAGVLIGTKNPSAAKSNYCDVNDLLVRFSIHSSIHRVEASDNNCRTDDRCPLQQLGPAFGGRPRRHFPG